MPRLCNGWTLATASRCIVHAQAGRPGTARGSTGPASTRAGENLPAEPSKPRLAFFLVEQVRADARLQLSPVQGSFGQSVLSLTGPIDADAVVEASRRPSEERPQARDTVASADSTVRAGFHTKMSCVERIERQRHFVSGLVSCPPNLIALLQLVGISRQRRPAARSERDPM